MRTTSHPTPSARRSLWSFSGALLLCIASAPVQAAKTDLAGAPLMTSTPSLVKPNIMFALDDSGSMSWDVMPDWAHDGDDNLVRNSAYNGVYYNPAITYSPPIKYDNVTRYPSMTSAQTTAWTSVPFDGFGVQKAVDINTSLGGNLFTPNTAGTTQNLTSQAKYYTFIAGEYCTTPKLTSCATQSAPSGTYSYPALLRWCTDATLSTCQANRVEQNTADRTPYLFARYAGYNLPGVGAKATIRVSAGGTVTRILVNGQIITSGSVTAGTRGAMGAALANAINNCTSATTGTCAVAGYQATYDSTQRLLIIQAPYSTPAQSATPTVVVSFGTPLGTVSSFSGQQAAIIVPGSNSLTTISASTTSYAYPGTTAKAESRTDCASATCTYAEEMSNFANWWAYYRTRMQMMKSAASIAFSTLDSRYRIGYMSINNNTGADFLNTTDIESTLTSSGQKAQWYTKLTSALPKNSTPLLGTLSKAGRYYAGKLKGATVNGVTATDPMQYACQRNYTILSTDGYWNDSNNPKDVTNTNDIGDVDGVSGTSRPYYDGNAVANTLADVALYYYNTDLRDATKFSNNLGSLGTDVASNTVAETQQRMFTSTVGLGASGVMLFKSGYATAKTGDFADVRAGTSTSTTTAASGTCGWQTSGACNWPAPVADEQTTIDDLWHTAVNGHGTYYSATNPSELQTSLQSFLIDVQAKTANAAAATTSNPNVSAGDNYVFKSTFKSVDWFGELAQYTINTDTGALSATATWSQSGTALATQATANAKETYTSPLLDLISPASRKIYTYDPTNVDSTLLPFKWGNLTSVMQDMFSIPAINGLSQMCSSGTQCLPSTSRVNSAPTADGTGTTLGAGGINLVNYLRGERSNAGPDTGTYFFARTHALGDIVDSQAVYVKVPQFNYADDGYEAFRTAQKDRGGAIYVGANDGMLHAFNATNGAENWAYIPSTLLPKLYKLADKNYATDHQYYINATPRQGDVYYDSEWHTILVSGLGAGGRGFFALDITSPTSPKVLWEFTHDTTKGAGYTKDADVGYSYGTPLISKLSDGTWVVIVSSGYNNVGPGNGHGIVWVLNAKTGAIIKKIDTGFGSADAITGVCSTAPCPAGLTKLSAYVASSGTDNRALRVYGGDLYGNLWRVDLSALTGSGGDATVQLLAELKDANGKRQPITARPEVGNVNGATVVYLGTGAYLGVPDLNNDPQSVYAIKDNLELTSANSGTRTATYSTIRGNACDSSTNASCFVKQTLVDTKGVRTATSSVSYSVDFATMNGWFADLPETGERMNNDPDLQLGTLAFTTNIPNSTDACSIGGSSYINFLDYKTGLAVPNANKVGSLLSSGGTTALASAATMVRLPNGKVIAITNLSDGTSVTTEAPTTATNQRTRRVSWRELISDR